MSYIHQLGELYRQGHSLNRISAETQLHRNKVWRLLKSLNEEMRPVGRPKGEAQ